MTETIKFGKDRTANWDWYFPPRNGVAPELKVNRNFDAETLNYASTAGPADKITANIVERMRGRKFFVIECCAGIGGNTLSFLNHPDIYGVKSFERNPTRRLWLKRNIMAFNLGNKSIVPDISEEGLSGEEDFSEFKECVFYFDPPWLPESFKGGADYKKHYITKDMKVGKKTLEQWMARNKEVASLMVFRVPPRCVIEEVPGWTFEVQDLKDSGLVYYCFNNMISGSNNGTKTTKKIVNSFSEIKFKNVDFTNEGGFGSLLPIFDMCQKDSKHPQCKVFLQYSFVDPEPPIESVKQGLTVAQEEKKDLGIKKDSSVILPLPEEEENDSIKISGKVRDNFRKKFQNLPLPNPKVSILSAQWVADFQEFIYQILMIITDGKEKICKMLIEEDAMKIWVVAFTQKTIDVNPENNYDSYESIGDVLLGASFKILALQRLGKKDGSASVLNDLKSAYMAKEFQADISQLLHFPEWVRISEEGKINKSIHIKEDLFESFAGALYYVAEEIKPGLGFLLVRQFLDTIFENIELKKKFQTVADKSAVLQRFEKIGSVQSVMEETIGKGTIQILLLNDMVLEKSRRFFPELQSRVLAVEKSDSLELTSTRNRAWAKAKKYIESIGMTEEECERIKQEGSKEKLMEANPTLYNLVRNKLQRQGYSNFEFDLPQNLANQYSRTAILIGVREEMKNGKKTEVRENLTTGSGKTDTEAKLDAMENYKRKLV